MSLAELIRKGATAGLLTVAATGCSSDEVTGHNEEEPDPAGMFIDIDGIRAVTVSSDGTVTGTLNVPLADETSNFDVTFTAADGDVINADPAEFFAAATFATEGLAIFHSVGPFRGHLEGEAAGSTTVVFSFMHPPGPTAHSNWDSPAITVTVQ